jgi:hypothetical protein
LAGSGWHSRRSFDLAGKDGVQFQLGPWWSARFFWARPESARSFVVSPKKRMTAIDTTRDLAIYWPIFSIFPKIDVMTDEFRPGPQSSSFEVAYQ